MGFKSGIRLCLLTAALGLVAGISFAQTTPPPADSTAAPAAATSAPATTAPADTVAPPAATTPPPAATTPAPATTAPAPAVTTPPPAAAAPAATATTSTPAATTPPPPATAPPPAQSAQSAGPSGPFDRGRTRATFTVGWGQSFGDDYVLVGVGLGRYIKRGLEVGLYYEGWVGSDIGVNKLTPRITYVLTRSILISPYVGAFYTRAFIDGYDDLSSWGGRAGVYKGQGRVSYGVGVVWENYLDFDENTYGGDATNVYPEVFIGTTF